MKCVLKCRKCHKKTQVNLSDGEVSRCTLCSSENVEIIARLEEKKTVLDHYKCDRCNHIGLGSYPLDLEGKTDKSSPPNCVCGSNKTKWSAPKGLEGFSWHFEKYKCNTCKHEGENMLEMNDGLVDWETADPCDNCQGTNLIWLVKMPQINRWGEIGFPYYDNGLGVEFQSKAERDQYIKKHNLIEVGGDVDFSGELSKIKSQHAKEDQIVADYEDRLENDPGFASFRKARENGSLPQQDHKEQASADVVDPFSIGGEDAKSL